MSDGGLGVRLKAKMGKRPWPTLANTAATLDFGGTPSAVHTPWALLFCRWLTRLSPTWLLNKVVLWSTRQRTVYSLYPPSTNSRLPLLLTLLFPWCATNSDRGSWKKRHLEKWSTLCAAVNATRYLAPMQVRVAFYFLFFFFSNIVRRMVKIKLKLAVAYPAVRT